MRKMKLSFLIIGMILGAAWVKVLDARRNALPEHSEAWGDE